MKWILASRSPRRIEILNRIGINPIIFPVEIKEERLKGEKPREYVMRLSKQKVEKAAEKFSSGIIIGADTIVVLDGKFLGKPQNDEEARKILSLLSGKKHFVYTGLTLLKIEDKTLVSDYEKSTVFFIELTEEMIDWYIKSKEPMDKAGAYGIQGKAGIFVEKIEGCYFNIVGFPLNLFYRLSKKLNINLFR
ncbi:Maf family protein [Candidatus Aminicenantes bacterium AC-335-A11]|jgi:septum formation protein|nr:Maf family protein [SCandidatus Aminicenantes bacterium Aminicenantia_JdfR_composite]MCP2597127.1 Maf family protein [Candidatus Aminicenantes bacterium AC-335-G13]MCP2606456.1 Maf family protein [Candidatus Aminicenantes bacterium AC-708-I09]MCP2618606.1 Maf family protein [Candidatus Aminicenantes bacterium AC-335-A11]